MNGLFDFDPSFATPDHDGPPSPAHPTHAHPAHAHPAHATNRACDLHSVAGLILNPSRHRRVVRVAHAAHAHAAHAHATAGRAVFAARGITTWIAATLPGLDADGQQREELKEVSRRICSIGR